MLSASELIHLAIGTSSALALLTLLAGFYYNLEVRRTDSSDREGVVGPPVLGRKETWKFLNKFKDERLRIEALKTLQGFHEIDDKTARDYLKQVVKTHVERRRTTAFSSSAIFFVVIAVLALFDKYQQSQTPPIMPPDTAVTGATAGGKVGPNNPAPSKPAPETVRPRQVAPVKPLPPAPDPANLKAHDLYLQAESYYKSGDFDTAFEKCQAASKLVATYSTASACTKSKEDKEFWHK